MFCMCSGEKETKTQASEHVAKQNKKWMMSEVTEMFFPGSRVAARCSCQRDIIFFLLRTSLVEEEKACFGGETGRQKVSNLPAVLPDFWLKRHHCKMDNRTEILAAFAACVTVKSQDEYIARHGEYSLYDVFRKVFPQVPPS
jgi:hypothetical protein